MTQENQEKVNNKGHDSVAQALEDHAAGPIKKSIGMTVSVVAATLFLLGSATIFILFKTTGLTSFLAYTSLGLATLSPLVGVVFFVMGYTRKYRYKLGRLLEKLGIAIILIIPLLAILFFVILK